MAGKKKKPEQVKNYMLRVRMTEEDRQLLEEAAKAKSLQVSSWARSELLALARALLAEKVKG
jgi:uncharacterized protein (DUF1778 family)